MIPTPAPDTAIPVELLPTDAENTATALMDWLVEHPSADEGGVAIADDLKTVEVYWKGSAPAGL